MVQTCFGLRDRRGAGPAVGQSCGSIGDPEPGCGGRCLGGPPQNRSVTDWSILFVGLCKMARTDFLGNFVINGFKNRLDSQVLQIRPAPIPKSARLEIADSSRRTIRQSGRTSPPICS